MAPLTSSTILLAVCISLHTSQLVGSFTPISVRPQSVLASSSIISLGATSTPSVLCIGDALFDCIANDDARGMAVEDMVAKNAWTAWPGGAPANVATALCKLGTSSGFAGCVGNDAGGDEIELLLRDVGVDVTLLRRSMDSDLHPTRRVMVTRDEMGDRAFAGFFEGRSADAFADCFLDVSTLQDDESDVVIKGADWLVCSTLSLAFEQSAAAINQVVERGIASGARLYVDINWRDVFWQEEDVARESILQFSQQADIVKLTDEEATWLLGIPADEALANPAKVGAAFPNALAVLVTAGEKGAAYSAFGHTGIVHPFQVEVSETTGAGDAFTAGFLHGLLQSPGILDKKSDGEKVASDGQELVVKDLVRFAAAVGALTCTSEGAIAAQPTLKEVESFLSCQD